MYKIFTWSKMLVLCTSSCAMLMLLVARFPKPIINPIIPNTDIYSSLEELNRWIVMIQSQTNEKYNGNLKCSWFSNCFCSFSVGFRSSNGKCLSN